jgi:hypothetical protein
MFHVLPHVLLFSEAQTVEEVETLVKLAEKHAAKRTKKRKRKS